MPLPFIIGGIAAVAGAAGVGTGIHGGLKMKEANDTMKLAQTKQERAVALFNKRNDETLALMDDVGAQELKILSSFDDFSNIIEKIQGRPEFKKYEREGIDLPEYEAEELKKISAGAGLLLGGIGSATAGTAGGFAAAGATSAAVMALGTASTGTAISSLSGVAATNAALAALGGGSLAAGGGGMALGATVLSGATLGIGLLVGGIIFNATGSKLSDKADPNIRMQAFIMFIETLLNYLNELDKEKINSIIGNTIVHYFDELTCAANDFKEALTKVENIYRSYLDTLGYIVNFNEKTNWNDFTDKEKKVTENTVLLVGLLYTMCRVKLVLKQDNEELNKVNRQDIDNVVADTDVVLSDMENVI